MASRPSAVSMLDGAPPAPCPRRRHLAGAAWTGGRFWVFGGLAGDASGEPDGLEALGDLWAWRPDGASGAWAAVDASGESPAARFGHGLVADGPAAFLVTGGRERDREDEDRRAIFDDIWRCDAARRPRPASGSGRGEEGPPT